MHYTSERRKKTKYKGHVTCAEHQLQQWMTSCSYSSVCWIQILQRLDVVWLTLLISANVLRLTFLLIHELLSVLNRNDHFTTQFFESPLNEHFISHTIQSQYIKQESILVGCVPSAAVAVGGVCPSACWDTCPGGLPRCMLGYLPLGGVCHSACWDTQW